MKKKAKVLGIIHLVIGSFLLLSSFLFYIAIPPLPQESFSTQTVVLTEWKNSTNLKANDGKDYHCFAGLLVKKEREALVGNEVTIVVDEKQNIYSLSCEEITYFSIKEADEARKGPYYLFSGSLAVASILFAMVGVFRLLSSREKKVEQTLEEFPFLDLEKWKSSQDGLFHLDDLHENQYDSMSIGELKVYRLSNHIPEKLLVYYKEEQGLFMTFCEQVKKDSIVVPFEKEKCFVYPLDKKKETMSNQSWEKYCACWKEIEKKGYHIHLQKN